MSLHYHNRFRRQAGGALLTSLVLSVVASGICEAAIVQFRKTVQSSSPVVTLGDVADVKDADPAVVAQLSKIVLAPAPVPGGQLRLEFDAIRAGLAAHGVDPARTEFGGASVVIVTSGDKRPTLGSGQSDDQDVPEWKKKRAERLITEAVCQSLRGTAPDLGSISLALDLKNNEVEEILLGAASGYEVRGGAPPWNEPQVFQIRFLDRREQIHSLTVRATVTSQPQVVAAKYNIPRGHILQADDLVWKQSAEAGETISDVAQALNRETTRMLRANEPIMRGDVRATPLVRANDIVTVYANTRGMNVKRRMKARTEGAMDEMVTLVSLDGKQSLNARVIGYHEAEVSAPPTAGRIEPNAVRQPEATSVRQPEVINVAPATPALQTVNGDSLHRPQRPNSVATPGRRS